MLLMGDVVVALLSDGDAVFDVFELIFDFCHFIEVVETARCAFVGLELGAQSSRAAQDRSVGVPSIRRPCSRAEWCRSKGWSDGSVLPQ